MLYNLKKIFERKEDTEFNLRKIHKIRRKIFIFHSYFVLWLCLVSGSRYGSQIYVAWEVNSLFVVAISANLSAYAAIDCSRFSSWIVASGLPPRVIDLRIRAAILLKFDFIHPIPRRVHHHVLSSGAFEWLSDFYSIFSRRFSSIPSRIFHHAFASGEFE